MKKLFISIFLIAVTYTSIFAETGVECSSSDTRCSAYDLDVEAEVLRAITFEQVRPLNIGQTTKGETVLVEGHNFAQERGKLAGLMYITTGYSSENISIKCLKELSYVNFVQGGDPTGFDSCSLESDGMMMSILEGSGTNEILVTGVGIYELGHHYLAVTVGGEIKVPSNATTGSRTGVMRIEVTYL